MSKVPGILKTLRAERGVTQDQLADAIQVSKSLIAAFENRRLIPQPDTARHLDRFFASGDKVQEAAAEASEERRHERAQQPTWFKPWREIEETASILRYFQNSLIPGLLQTEEYARSVLVGGPHNRREIDQRLAARMERQHTILEREDAPLCTFMLDAAALRYNDRKIAKNQLTRLLDAGDRGQFIRIVPEDAPMHPGRSVSFILATLETANVVGYMEDLFEGRVITDPAKVIGLDRAWHTICGIALPFGQSRDLILKMVNDL